MGLEEGLTCCTKLSFSVQVFRTYTKTRVYNEHLQSLNSNMEMGGRDKRVPESQKLTGQLMIV